MDSPRSLYSRGILVAYQINYIRSDTNWFLKRSKKYEVFSQYVDLVQEDVLGIETHIGPDEVAMVGDRVYTDIAMARNAGALPVLVLSGETTAELAAKACLPGDLVLPDLSHLAAMLHATRFRQCLEVDMPQSK